MASTIDSFEENFEKKKEMKKKIPVILWNILNLFAPKFDNYEI